mmetsp:Transcript_26755/g.88966  ORF Transcript_26755/g.88966 Transcript_26755/m.88966 type:complete len:99 (+) Transcript_26755:214-510(+)
MDMLGDVGDCLGHDASDVRVHVAQAAQVAHDTLEDLPFPVHMIELITARRLSSSLDASQSSTRSERMRSAMAKMTSTEVQDGSPMMPIGVAKVTRNFC